VCGQLQAPAALTLVQESPVLNEQEAACTPVVNFDPEFKRMGTKVVLPWCTSRYESVRGVSVGRALRNLNFGIRYAVKRCMY